MSKIKTFLLTLNLGILKIFANLSLSVLMKRFLQKKESTTCGGDGLIGFESLLLEGNLHSYNKLALNC